ncbi:MAG: adenylate/guanylate cyclase domain-containing protein [Chitinophagaceae bacterium]
MRQLAAIVFADMTGYTALMQENEQLAMQKRKKMRDVLEATLPLHHGKIIQYYGDGSLCIFNSAINAVSCFVSIQQQMLTDPKVDMRIGIHTGDITIDEDTVFGDGVNLASRIESLAVPGSVFISEKVYDEIRNQQHISCREMGYFEFKNVKEPVRVFAISNDGIVIPQREDLKGKTRQPNNKLAVLPFMNISADPENEYFSDGITEELLNALTKVEGLQVTSRTSAFAFKGKQDDIREIAIKLNVDKVLEGSVRKAGNRVRITAQLINAADGYHIWSETYDRNLTDIFEVQDEISSIITNRLRENLSPTVQAEQPAKPPTDNVEAYNLFLRAVHNLNKLTPADTRKAIELLEEAVQLEPGFARAYGKMAHCYSYLGALGQVNQENAFRLVQEYSDKALQLDNTVVEGYLAKAAMTLFYEWKFEKAFEYLQKATELNPGDTNAAQLLSHYYICTDKKDKAVQVMEQALVKDPLSPVINSSLAEAYLFNEQYPEAIRQADHALEIYPELRTVMQTKGHALAQLGNWEEALKLFQKVYELTGHPLKGLTGLGYALAKMGRREEAMECIRKMEQRQQQFPDSSIEGDFIFVYTGLEEYDKVFYYMEEAIERRLGPAKLYLQHPVFKEIKQDPRYPELEKRMSSL